jgi:hypothetical protein
VSVLCAEDSIGHRSGHTEFRVCVWLGAWSLAMTWALVASKLRWEPSSPRAQQTQAWAHSLEPSGSK